jgi:hypothetical protein
LAPTGKAWRYRVIALKCICVHDLGQLHKCTWSDTGRRRTHHWTTSANYRKYRLRRNLFSQEIMICSWPRKKKEKTLRREAFRWLKMWYVKPECTDTEYKSAETVQSYYNFQTLQLSSICQ